MRRRGRWNPRHRPGWMVGMLSEKEKKGDKENEILPRSSTKIHKPAPFKKKKKDSQTRTSVGFVQEEGFEGVFDGFRKVAKVASDGKFLSVL